MKKNRRRKSSNPTHTEVEVKGEMDFQRRMRNRLGEVIAYGAVGEDGRVLPWATNDLPMASALSGQHVCMVKITYVGELRMLRQDLKRIAG